MTRFNLLSLCCWGAAITVAASASFAQSVPANDWLIVPGLRVGPITAATTRADLVRLFGLKNVVDEDITVSDAGPTPGTVIYRDRPSDSLSISWADGKHGLQLDFIALCLVPGQVRTADSCHWHTQEKISFGTSLKELENLNRRAFELSRFGWDYGGAITSWKGGALEAIKPPCGGLGLRVNPSPTRRLSPEESALADSGLSGKIWSSAAQRMQLLNPLVDRMNLSFAGCSR